MQATELRFNYHLIRLKRKQLGITQAALAKATGVSQGMISRIENGDLSPGFRTAITITTALELTLNDLLVEGAESA